MSNNSISIEFEDNSNHPGYFAPGSTITGFVLVTISDFISCQCITLHANGLEKTLFKKDASTCVAEKRFFSYNFTLWKAASEADELIPPGEHCFKFAFEIPENCLPNFDGKYGHIRYLIKVEVQSGAENNLWGERSFQVLSDSLDSLKCEKPLVKSFSTNDINVEVTLPKECFHQNETIPLNVNIQNLSSSFIIDSIETGIKTKICYKGYKKVKGESYDLLEFENLFSLPLIDKLFIPFKEQKSYSRNLELSALSPTIEDEIINVSHFVFVKLHKKSLPSTVTHIIPFTLYSAKMSPIPSAPMLQNIPNQITPTAPEPFEETFGAPPSYTEIENNQSITNSLPSSPPSNYDESFSQKF